MDAPRTAFLAVLRVAYPWLVSTDFEPILYGVDVAGAKVGRQIETSVE